MLGLNSVRYFYKIKMSGFTTVLGIIALVGGVLELFWLKNLEGAILLLKPWFDKQRLFGKAEEG